MTWGLSRASRHFTGGKTYNLRQGMADLLGYLVEGGAAVLGGSVAGTFQNPTSLSSPFPPSVRLC